MDLGNKQLLTAEAAIGKTVAAYHDCQGWAVVLFTDGTFLALHAEGASWIYDTERDPPAGLLHDAGIITDLEWVAEVKRERAQREQAERAELARLSAKYGAKVEAT